MNGRSSILVTGGAGYIGSHCCMALNAAGFQPVTYDNLSTGHEAFVRWGPLVVGDIRDTATLEATLRTHGISAVMHFAAASSVSESVADPIKYYSNNVVGSLSLLTAMASVNCRDLVLSSTGAVYGETASGLVSETAPCSPMNPYGRSKLMVEQAVADFRGSYGMRAISLRYFNASGADPGGKIGELRKHETHLIPRALMKSLGHLCDFAIFGQDFDTPDGTAVRDYIHVMDLAQAHLLALTALDGGTNSGTFNLGTGLGYSVKDIIAEIEDVTGRRLEAPVRDRRQGDPAFLVADPTAAATTLGFRPKYSDLRSIVASAWSWHQKAHAPARSRELDYAGAT